MWDENVYYSPETWGLEQFGMLSDPNADYSFDDLVVWKHLETGELYWATDSGCSCPSPFEDFRSMDDLVHLDGSSKSWDEFQEAVGEHCGGWWDGTSFGCDKVELLAKCARWLRDSKPTPRQVVEAEVHLLEVLSA